MGYPKVSVVVVTFNHEEFIKEALLSIFSQDYLGEIEVIIGDDASTDSNVFKIKELLTEYKLGNNFSIRLFDRQTNIGANPNFLSCLNESKGKYIAILEGDDKWNDKTKIFKQVAFLEANNDYSVCYHDFDKIDQLGEVTEKDGVLAHRKKDQSVEDLIKGAWLPTQTMLFRSEILPTPKEMYGVYNGDTFVTSVLGLYGKGAFLNTVKNSLYRIHDGGVWSGKSNILRKFKSINTYISLRKFHSKKSAKGWAPEYYKQRYFNELEIILDSRMISKIDIVKSLFRNIRYLPFRDVISFIFRKLYK